MSEDARQGTSFSGKVDRRKIHRRCGNNGRDAAPQARPGARDGRELHGACRENFNKIQQTKGYAALDTSQLFGGPKICSRMPGEKLSRVR